MDIFDQYDTVNLQKNEKTYENPEDLGILDEKRDIIFKFFSNPKSLIVVILLVLMAIPGVINLFIAPEGGRDFLSFIFEVIFLGISLLLPIGVIMIYLNAKKRDDQGFIKGIDTAQLYFKIMKIFLIIIAVLSGIVFMSMVATIGGMAFTFLFVMAAVITLAMYVIQMFKTFFHSLGQAISHARTGLPSTNKLKTLMIVLAVLAAISFGLFMIYFSRIETLLNDYDVPATVLLILDTAKLFLSIVFGLTILVYLYFVYYFESYSKEMDTFNMYLKKRVKQLNEQLYEKRLD